MPPAAIATAAATPSVAERRLSRRSLFERGLLVVCVLPAAAALEACGGGGMGGAEGRGMREGMPDWMMTSDGMMDPQMREHMRVIRQLLQNHRQIERQVEDVPGGVRTHTTSSDPRLAELIETHVRQMKHRVEAGNAIRHMDPLFREIFEHHDEIEMDVRRLDSGVVVLETSDDSDVALLIRQHAHRAVSEFAADGMSRAREPTPLPEGYRG